MILILKELNQLQFLQNINIKFMLNSMVLGMNKRFQSYAVSKDVKKPSYMKINLSPGPGSYNTNISSFRKLRRKKHDIKGRLMV